MRLPMSWLREYVDVALSAGELAERLLHAGLAVEGVERVGETWAGLVVGRVQALQRHPARPDLWVARVALGRGRVAQAVTGAPNVRVGLTTAVAPAGVRPAGLPEPVRETDFLGVRSQAVVLSPREAGISDDHSGLWELPDDLPAGAPLAEALGLADEVLEVDVYPNRADCMSVVGLAREVAAALGLPLREPDLDYQEQPGWQAAELCRVEVDSAEDCPRYVARVVEVASAGSCPWWLARRLLLAGMRPIHPVVDVTNYVMLEVGQPLHAFDLDRLAQGQVVVRRARPGEHVVTLDGRERELDPEVLVIADADRPQALAGIMGGAASEVSATTRRVLLEAATFRPALVRRAARRLGLRTEASARFERGLAPYLAEWGSRRAAALLWRMGGRVASGRVERYASPEEADRHIRLRPQRLQRVLGLSLPLDTVAERLRGLGAEVSPAGGGGADGRTAREGAVLDVRIPPWRRDLAEEDDLVEEVARLHGYDRIPSTLPRATYRGRWAPETALAFQVRRTLSGAGLFEVLTYSFMGLDELDQLGIPADHPHRAALRVANPLGDEASYLRTTLRVGLARVLRLNGQRRRGSVRVFEVGRIFRPSPAGAAGAGGEEQLPQERVHVGIALMDVPAAMRRQWYEPLRPADFYDLKGLVEALGQALRVELAFEPAELAGLHPGRCATALALAPGGDSVPVGYLGELHPAVVERLELPGRALVAELDLAALAGARRGEPRFEPLPRYPAVVRDLALVVPREMAAARLVERVRQLAGPLAVAVHLFDVYEGPGLPPQTRSLGVSVTYQAPDRTLSDEEVDRAREALVEALAREGIRLR